MYVCVYTLTLARSFSHFSSLTAVWDVNVRRVPFLFRVLRIVIPFYLPLQPLDIVPRKDQAFGLVLLLINDVTQTFRNFTARERSH